MRGKETYQYVAYLSVATVPNLGLNSRQVGVPHPAITTSTPAMRTILRLVIIVVVVPHSAITNPSPALNFPDTFYNTFYDKFYNTFCKTS